MAVRLEFLTQDQQAIDFAKRYWAMDHEGAFQERLVDLLPFRMITLPSAVAKYVREICRAYDENQTCPLCGGLLPVGARTNAKKTPRRAYEPCKDCQEDRRKEQEAREATKRAELEMYLAPYIAEMQAKTVSYRAFTDDTVIILQAIGSLIGQRLGNGSFSLDDCMQLTPTGVGDFIDRLYLRGALEDHPTDASDGTYFVKDDRLWINKAAARYFLPPDTEKGRGLGAIKELHDRQFSDAEALTNLWLDYAVTDVMRYMHYQCSIYNQELDHEAIEKVKNMIRQALSSYSVAQIWFIVWKVTRDAATLASRSYYNQEKATATIPTKIRKQLEEAEQGKLLPNHWSRPEPHIIGALGMVFKSLFGLDEFSKGIDVPKIFLSIEHQDYGEADAHKIAAIFMEDTLKGQTSFEALDAFSDLIRVGLSTKDAIVEIRKSHSKLFHTNPLASI